MPALKSPKLTPAEAKLVLAAMNSNLGPPAAVASASRRCSDPKPVRHCRVCGCTDSDCRQCIAKLGRACYWTEKDLCSACDKRTMDYKDASDRHRIERDRDAGELLSQYALSVKRAGDANCCAAHAIAQSLSSRAPDCNRAFCRKSHKLLIQQEKLLNRLHDQLLTLAAENLH